MQGQKSELRPPTAAEEPPAIAPQQPAPCPARPVVRAPPHLQRSVRTKIACQSKGGASGSARQQARMGCPGCTGPHAYPADEPRAGPCPPGTRTPPVAPFVAPSALPRRPLLAGLAPELAAAPAARARCGDGAATTPANEDVGVTLWARFERTRAADLLAPLMEPPRRAMLAACPNIRFRLHKASRSL